MSEVHKEDNFQQRDVLEQLAAAVQWWNADEAEEPDVRRLFAACKAEIERLRTECSNLAATACEKPEADERGHTFCGRVADLEAQIRRLSEADSKIATLRESMRLDAETIAAKDAKIQELALQVLSSDGQAHENMEYAQNVTAAAQALVAECDRRAKDLKEGRATRITVPWLDLQVLREIIATNPTNTSEARHAPASSGEAGTRDEGIPSGGTEKPLGEQERADRIRANMLAAEAWPDGTTRDEKRLRGLLARRVGITYGDDGELQSNEPRPAIDFKRDSVDEIERKLYERTLAKLAKEQHSQSNTQPPVTFIPLLEDEADALIYERDAYWLYRAGDRIRDLSHYEEQFIRAAVEAGRKLQQQHEIGKAPEFPPDTNAERVKVLNDLAAWLRRFAEDFAAGSEPGVNLRVAADIIVAQSEDYYDATKVTSAMVDRFLAWPLPDSVCSDLCVTKQGPGRIGTQLLTADEARAMLEHVHAIGGSP